MARAVAREARGSAGLGVRRLMRLGLVTGTAGFPRRGSARDGRGRRAVIPTVWFQLAFRFWASVVMRCRDLVRFPRRRPLQLGFSRPRLAVARLLSTERMRLCHGLRPGLRHIRASLQDFSRARLSRFGCGNGLSLQRLLRVFGARRDFLNVRSWAECLAGAGLFLVPEPRSAVVGGSARPIAPAVGPDLSQEDQPLGAAQAADQN